MIKPILIYIFLTQSAFAMIAEEFSDSSEEEEWPSRTRSWTPEPGEVYDYYSDNSENSSMCDTEEEFEAETHPRFEREEGDCDCFLEFIRGKVLRWFFP